MQQRLNRRQMEQQAAQEDIANTLGKWDQSVGANGAHYIPADVNPFIDEGLMCASCVFFLGSGRCAIVGGFIENEGLCKLWLIPEGLIS